MSTILTLSNQGQRLVFSALSRYEGIVVSDAQIERRREQVFKPLEHYRIYRNAVVAGTVNPHYINPQQGLDRLQKLMDEYCGGYTVGYMTNEKLQNICLKKLTLKE